MRNSVTSSIANKYKTPKRSDYYTGRSELDSHADTMVAGRNYIIMNYTDLTYTVSPYNENKYKPITGVSIVQAITGYTSKSGCKIIRFLENLCILHILWVLW